MTGLAAIDRHLSQAILFAPHPPWLTTAMIFLTRPENFFLAIAASVFFLLLWGGRRGRFLVFSAALGVAISDPLASRVLKSLFGRIRPCHADPPQLLPIGCSDSYSFPSSHAVNIFCEATIVSMVYPRAAPFAYLLAAAVGYSRLYLGVHFPFDVLGGAAIGTAVGYGTVSILRRISGLRDRTPTP